MKKLILAALALTVVHSANAKLSGEKVDKEQLFSAEELTIEFAMEEIEIEEEVLQNNLTNDINTQADFGDILGDIIGDAIRDRVFGRRVICQAQNRRGRIFEAEGRRPMRVQRRALRQCHRISRRPRTCRQLGCFRSRY